MKDVKNRMFLFELLQIALGSRDSFSAVPTSDEWVAIYEEAERQAVTGILLHGFDRLPSEHRPPKAFLFQWIGTAQMIEQRNNVMNKHCVKLLRKLDDFGLNGTILKGQGLAVMYDAMGEKNDVCLGKLRLPGDIVVYVDWGIERALAFAKKLGQHQIEWDYKHLHLNVWDDTEVEMHYRVEVLLNLWKNRKLQRWFKEHNAQARGSSFMVDGYAITIPTVEFNVFYILLHIYRHFLYEGVGLRQIVDYYMVLRTVQKFKGLRVQDYVEAVHEFGMEKFAKGLMWVMKTALGMPEQWMLWEPDRKEGEYILKQIMMGGNFGHYDERLNHSGGKFGAVKAILTHNLHLITHYPADVIWAPVWIVWHKMWKIKTKMSL